LAIGYFFRYWLFLAVGSIGFQASISKNFY